MPSTLFDNPPDVVQADINSLCQALDQNLPGKQPDRNLLIATWNIRAFGSLTRKWTAASSDNPKRDKRGLFAIIEIVKRFDVVGIQEVTGDLRALRELMAALGDDWSFLMTDVNLGAAGHNERMAFVFDNRRVKLSGLACELVVPPEWLGETGAEALNRQFARTPYAVSFRAGDTTFIMVSLHIDYGDDSAERVPELYGIARWMADWAKKTTSWDHNLITLGDFNIDRWGSGLWQAFTSTGLVVPEKLQTVPRSIFADPNDPMGDKYYDQIAWFANPSTGIPLLSMTCTNAGYFDFLPYVYTDANLSKSSISYRISDHYPLWAEFSI